MTKISTLTPSFPSQLPAVGTTIFSIMSELACKHHAINLGQGFPDFPCDPQLIEHVHHAMVDHHNQYPPMIGIPELRNAISEKIAHRYGHHYDPEHEITITAGGTQAILTAILCCVSPGDEVIILEPAYDSYQPAITLAGGICIPISLKPILNPDGPINGYSIPWEEIAQAISRKTRALIVNTPHNPTGMVWQQADLDRLADLIQNTNALILSDEVYEHMVYDGREHCSIASHPQLASRAFVVSSFGKTFHVTGWKIGYVAAPPSLSSEFRKIHQFNVFTVNTPMQYGIARYLQMPAHYLNLPNFYQAKRDYFRNSIQGTGLKLLPCEGTYFQCADYSGLDIPQRAFSDTDFCQWLIREIGVAAIPISAFYQNEVDSKVIRFCFAKQDQTLENAIMRLRTIEKKDKNATSTSIIQHD